MDLLVGLVGHIVWINVTLTGVRARFLSQRLELRLGLGCELGSTLSVLQPLKVWDDSLVSHEVGFEAAIHVGLASECFSLPSGHSIPAHFQL